MTAPFPQTQHSIVLRSGSNDYIKPRTMIPATTSTSTSVRHNHQRKTALTRGPTITRYSMVAGSSGASVSKHAYTKHKHHRSKRYTRTLDIILEEQQNHTDDRSPCGDRNNATEDHPHCSSVTNSTTCNNSIIATDYWLSMRGMKKSAASVSLESLIMEIDEDDDTDDDASAFGVNDENKRPNSKTIEPIHFPANLVVEDNDDYFDNFLDDWEL